MKWYTWALATFMLLVTLQGALAAPGDIIFQDFTNGTLTDLWQGSTSNFAYQPGWLNYTAATASYVRNITQVYSTGVYMFNVTMNDNGAAIAAASYINFGVSNFSGLSAPSGNGNAERAVELMSGVCNAYQTQYALNYRSMNDCAAGGVGTARVTGNNRVGFIIDLTNDKAQFWVNGVNIRNQTIGATWNIRSIFFQANVFKGYKITNITLCDTYCASVTPPATINTITLSLLNNVTGVTIDSGALFKNVTGSLTFKYFNITNSGFCVTYTGNGTATNCTSGSGTGTFYNVSFTRTVTGTTSFTNSTYQARISVRPYLKYINTTVTNFNLTNNKTYNTTTGSIATIKALLGANNIKVTPRGNYSLNISCSVSASFTSNNCTLQGIYDSQLKVGARTAVGAAIQTFNLTIINDTLSLSNLTATSSYTITFNILRGYNYTLAIDATDSVLTNHTLRSTSASQVYNFSLLTRDTFNLSIRDELTQALILQNFTVELISDVFANNYSTANGTLVISLLTPSEYTIRYRNPNYQERDYIITLSPQTYNTITLYSLNDTYATNVLVTVQDTDGNNIENATVKLLRYYISTNDYQPVEMSKTSASGEAGFWVQTYDGFYKWSVEYAGITRFLSTSPENIYTTTRIFVIDLGTNYYASTDKIDLISRSVTFNRGTGALTLTYNDPTGIMTQICLEAEKQQLRGYGTKQESCQTTSAGSIILMLTEANTSSYRYAVNVQTNTLYSDHTLLAGIIDALSSFNFGNLGTILASGIIITLALIFSFSATAVIIISGVGLIAMQTLNLMTWTGNFVVSFIALALGISIYLMRR